MLDTNAVIALIGRKSDALAKRIALCEEGDIGICAVVAHELYYGAFRSRKIAYNLETLRLFMGDFAVVDFDRHDALASGEIRAELASRGEPIGPCDVLIAGQAKARKMTLVTNNLSEFQRVSGLHVEDWTAP